MFEYIYAHKHTSWNRKLLQQSELCGCIGCRAIYPASEIFQWHQEDENGVEQTAICARCNIDGVIPDEAGYLLTNDILMKISIYNRGPEDAIIHVMPHLWYRNYWKHNSRYSKPKMKILSSGLIQAHSTRNGKFYFYYKEGDTLFCENETNNRVIYGTASEYPYVKDGINDFMVKGKPTVNPSNEVTKVAIHSI